jgi:hypothetical protein
MAARKAVRTLTVSNITLPILSAKPAAPQSVDVTEIAAFGDPSYTSVASPCVKYGDLVVKVLDEGSDPPVPGTQAVYTVATGYGDGGAGTASRSFARTMTVISVDADEVEQEGNLKAAFSLTLRPVGGDTPGFSGTGATTTTTTTSGT